MCVRAGKVQLVHLKAACFMYPAGQNRQNDLWFFSCMFSRYWCCILMTVEMNKNVVGTQMMACAASVCCAPWELPTHQAARSSRLMGYYLKVLPDIVVESILSTFPLACSLPSDTDQGTSLLLEYQFFSLVAGSKMEQTMIWMNKDLMRPYFISTRMDWMSVWESKDE